MGLIAELFFIQTQSNLILKLSREVYLCKRNYVFRKYENLIMFYLSRKIIIQDLKKNVTLNFIYIFSYFWDLHVATVWKHINSLLSCLRWAYSDSSQDELNSTVSKIFPYLITINHNVVFFCVGGFSSLKPCFIKPNVHI